VVWRWYHFIYGSDEELLYLQDFDHDLSGVPDVECNHWFRYILFLMIFGLICATLYEGGAKIFLIYFTLWTEVVTMVSVALSIWIT
jgi:hypothetical protein